MKTDIAIIESDSVIASMTRASYALAEAVSVSQTKTIIDVARAAEIYAKRQHLSESAINQATSVKVEAMRKLGEILRDTPKASGTAGVGRPKIGGTKKEPPKSDTPTLDELGLSKKESAVAQKLASLSDEAFEQVRSGSVTIAKAIAVVTAEKAKPTPVAAPSPTVAEPKPEVAEDGAPDAAELEASRIHQEAQAKTMAFMLATDAPLADLAAKNTQLEAQIKQLELRIAGLQNANNEHIRTIKSLRNQLKKVIS